jgi:two-component system, OmpR family, phosphate regulon sensor histidine kinase PhoR
MKKLRWPAILMITAIFAVTGFQLYWLKNNYGREKQNLDIKTMSSFRQTILHLQSSKLGLERFRLSVDSSYSSDVVISSKKSDKKNNRYVRREPEINLVSLIQEKLRDSLWIPDPAKGTHAIKINGSAFNNSYFDSLKKAGFNSIKTTINLSAGSDSVSLNPSMVKEVRVEKANKAPGQVVTIGYDKNEPKENSDSFEFRGDRPVFIREHFPGPRDETPENGSSPFPKNNAVFRFLYNMDSLALKDSVTVKEISEAYTTRLKEDKINVGFKVSKLDSANTESPNAITIGFSKPATFSLSLQNTFGYMLDKLKLPILFSLLLVGITVFSFVLLYRNMIKQQRLSALKNEFISNITHELKTPIATVGVAIEALKNFNAIHDPKRTMEYLDISQNELQRLNLLVDKVLKLSMFEKKEIELKYEVVNLKDIVAEVVSSMKLQIEKYHAQVLLNYEGDCSLQADKLHLLSVVFNLVDNALKYSKDNPLLKINVEEKENSIEMRIADNGIGISPEYHTKVFDKFFRVPHGDTHNAKGYGLGLSYVAHVVAKHKGTIRVESKSNEGTTFTISLPKKKP